MRSIEQVMEKVTIFITRKKNSRIELLLLRHPYAGIQFPAGTVEEDEDTDDAAKREIYEETGLKDAGLKDASYHKRQKCMQGLMNQALTGQNLGEEPG